MTYYPERDGAGRELPAGSLGTDYSVNPPALPLVGGGFGATGPFANYVLVKTVPANQLRAAIEVWNETGARIAVVRDDGKAGDGQPPQNASVFVLRGGDVPGDQGASWSSSAFKGRLQIFAPAALTGDAFVTCTDD